MLTTSEKCSDGVGCELDSAQGSRLASVVGTYESSERPDGNGELVKPAEPFNNDFLDMHSFTIVPGLNVFYQFAYVGNVHP